MRCVLSIFVCAVLAASLVSARPVYARDDVLVGDDSITVAVHVDLVGGTNSLAKRWSRAIDRAWNKGFTYCGRKVRFLVDMQVANGGSVRPEASRISVRQVRSGQSFRDETDWNFGSSPDRDNRWGEWASNADDGTIAHEFGHLVGLPDEYIDLPGQAPGTSEEFSVTLPQYADDNSIMAHHTDVVLPRHITDIIRHHSKLRSLYPCRWKGTIYSETVRDDETVRGHATGTSYPAGAVPHDNGAWICADSWRGDFEFTIDGGWPPVENESSPVPQNRPPGGPGGAVAGEGTLNLASHTCSPSDLQQYLIEVRGREAGNQFQLRVRAVGARGSGINWGGITSLFYSHCPSSDQESPPLTIALTAPDRAELQITTVQKCYANTFTSVNTIKLTRASR